MKKSKWELFVEIADPDEKGCSRWVSKEEFVGKYSSLMFQNGLDWGRKSSKIHEKYILEFDKKGAKIRLNGFSNVKNFKQNIKTEIKQYYKDSNCVMLGIRGNSENTRIEIDHKDGRKNDERVSNTETQRIEDFQPLCKAANDAKRQICKRCKETNTRWNAKNILGNPYSFYKGEEKYDEVLGCVGCYQYDPVEYRKECARRISKEASDYIMNKLYPQEKKE